ncbi:tetratricopeptide repeat protein [Corynebacterium striatum]|uniref:tetratricopeptide repeat protein n=1 Tax=Corynebacterium striatum TaxID=43770 RepID=UPI00066878C8|nr:tetratricopeptide repeat protein [Corynebacterium striatum]ATZ05559.1 co-chaperone YbbN [Corynebacterium striatum]MDK8876904.1 tetratricopeptide repeat protein [Corynebacterium striatum]NHX54062.1 co-chaperone YbbN [Corynebacterium striatum]NHY38589.1 co-chaperone YbbN [Corynebacterium striatum]HAT1134703.1 tetratricopeptide repeat protein [Corynebacterium striatum]
MTGPYVGGALDLGALKKKAEAPNDAPAGIAAFFEVTEENFEAELIHRSAEVPVIALIGSPRSPASEQLKADLKSLAEAGNLSFIVGYINADVVPQVAQVFGVQNLPTTVAIAAGQPVTNFEGAQPKDALEQWTGTLVEKLGPQLRGLSGGEAQEESEAPDSRLHVAEEALNRGDFDAAIAQYDEILASEPDNVEIKQARNTTVLLKRLDPANRSEDPVAAADAEPQDVAKQLDAADAEVVAGTPEKAFDRLIEGMKRTAGDEKQTLKDRLLELFGLFESSDPRVLKARTQLASALY